MWKSCHKIARAGSHRKGAPWPKRYSSDIARQFRLFCGSVGSSGVWPPFLRTRTPAGALGVAGPGRCPPPSPAPGCRPPRSRTGHVRPRYLGRQEKRGGSIWSPLHRHRGPRAIRPAASAPSAAKIKRPLAYRAQPVGCPGAQPGHGIGERALLRLTLMVREQRPTREAAMCGKCREHGSHTPQPSSAAAMGLAPQAARGPVVRPPWCVPGRSPGLPPAIALAHPRLCARTAVRWSAKPRFTSSTPGAYRP